MAKKQTRRKSARRSTRNFVAVTNKGYGRPLLGAKIYFEGQRPKGLKDDGSITFGKHILQSLRKRFPKFRWIITEELDSITTERGIVRVRTSQALLGRMNNENWDRSRDIKNDIVRRYFSIAFPTQFTDAALADTYVPGTLAGIVSPQIVTRLSSEDKEAVVAFLPAFVASEAIGAVNQLKASAQIETLKELVADLELQIGQTHAESWWQDYIKKNILLMQQGYIKALEKLNVALGDTKYPDFCLITHDNYVDILEIKKPDTPLLKHDASRNNYYWDAEIAKAIIQTENYIEHVSNKAAEVRSYLLDKDKINIKAVRPRGIVLAGDARRYESQKERDDLRLLSQGIKAVAILTYDELLVRVRNYIHVLEEFAGRRIIMKPASRKRRRS